MISRLLEKLAIPFVMASMVICTGVSAAPHQHSPVGQRLSDQFEENKELVQNLRDRLKNLKKKDKAEGALHQTFSGLEGIFSVVGLSSDVDLFNFGDRASGVVLANYFILELGLERWLSALEKSGISDQCLSVVEEAAIVFFQDSISFVIEIYLQNNLLPPESDLTQEELSIGVFSAAETIGDTLFGCTGNPYYANAWRQMAMLVLWSAQSFNGSFVGCVTPDDQFDEGIVSPVFFIDIHQIIEGRLYDELTCASLIT